MSDEIKNVGSKGYFFLFMFVAFLLFVVLVVSIYKYNMQFLPS